MLQFKENLHPRPLLWSIAMHVHCSYLDDTRDPLLVFIGNWFVSLRNDDLKCKVEDDERCRY